MGINIFNRKRITELATGAKIYSEKKINDWLMSEPVPIEDPLLPCMDNSAESQTDDGPIKFSMAPRCMENDSGFASGDNNSPTDDLINISETGMRFSLKTPMNFAVEIEKNIAISEVTFVTEMINYMNRQDLKNTSVYKAAGLDRRLFSKIISNPDYKPSRDTCLAIIIALKLTLQEAEAMLKSVGYAFSGCSRRDLIIEYMIREKEYDLDDINLVLYELGQTPIGEKCRF